MNSLYIENDVFSYSQLNFDIVLKLKSLKKLSLGLYIIEAAPTYSFLVKYLSLQKSNNSVLLVENIENLDQDILKELKLAFSHIYLPNKEIINQASIYNDSLQNLELILTSGTTSKKKIVTISRQTVADNTTRINKKFNVDSSVCEYINTPLHHSFGITRVRCGINRGANIYLAKNLLDHKMLKKCFTNENKIFLGSVSTGLKLFILFFYKYLITQENKFFYIDTGSMEISIDLLELIKKSFNNYIHFHHYGSSEVSRSFFANSKDLIFNSLNLGEISEGLEYKIHQDELLVKGSNLFSGYLSAGVLTYKIDNINTLTNDFYFKTGDFVKKKDDLILFNSRKKDIINLNGIKYSPLVLENKILTLNKSINDVVVIQYPGDFAYFIVCETNAKLSVKKDFILLINDISFSSFLIKPKEIFFTKIIKNSSRKKIRKHELYSNKF